MRDGSSGASTNQFFICGLDEGGVPVEISFALMERMQRQLAVSSDAVRGEEIGGLLLGSCRQWGDRHIIRVVDFELIACEHARGPSWTLSRQDRAGFARAIRRATEKRGLLPIGWFRTHTRPGVYLDQHDSELHNEYFAHPGSMVVAIRPEANGGHATAGLFFWEDGQLQRTRPLNTFTFNAELLGYDPPPPAPEPAPVLSSEPSLRVTLLGWAKRAALWAPVAAGLALGAFWEPADTAPRPVASVVVSETARHAVAPKPPVGESHSIPAVRPQP